MLGSAVFVKTQESYGCVARLKQIWAAYYLAPMMLILIIVSSVISRSFLTKENIVDILASNVTMSLLALGMFFVIVTGGIDLSVSSVVALSGCLLAGFLENGMSWPVAILATLAFSGLTGAISGVAVGYANIPPFIATLAMATIVRGTAYIYQVGSPKPIFDDTVIAVGDTILAQGWLPLPFFILVVITALSWFALTYLPFGRRLYAVGDNIEAARLSGLPVSRVLLLAYIISSLLAGVGGIVLASRLMLGSALVGAGYEQDAIASVIIGGASFAGGSGSAILTILGAYTFGLIANILNLLGIGGYPQMIIKGAIIVVALLAVRGRRQ